MCWYCYYLLNNLQFTWERVNKHFLFSWITVLISENIFLLRFFCKLYLLPPWSTHYWLRESWPFTLACLLHREGKCNYCVNCIHGSTFLETPSWPNSVTRNVFSEVGKLNPSYSMWFVLCREICRCPRRAWFRISRFPPRRLVRVMTYWLHVAHIMWP